ncbi:unnamed protein product [Spirodela intermedia]|uniref:Uncharacterized protein n=1 Tax=Spirodela intermedia TaxID=51605 RepID=A0ABN7EBM5_SPIIN|nr:unnamed protein product [Spirodela intermedia]
MRRVRASRGRSRVPCILSKRLCVPRLVDTPRRLALHTNLPPCTSTVHTLRALLCSTSDLGLGALPRTPQGGGFPLDPPSPPPTNHVVGSTTSSSSSALPSTSTCGVETPKVPSQPSLVIVCFDFILSFLKRVSTTRDQDEPSGLRFPCLEAD